MRIDHDNFFKVKGLKRLRYMDPFSRVVMVLSLVAGVAALAFALAKLFPALLAVGGVLAYAQGGGQPQPPTPLPSTTEIPYANIVILLIVGVAFLWSLGV